MEAVPTPSTVQENPAAKEDHELYRTFGVILVPPMTEKEYTAALGEVCELGKKPKGAMKLPQLSFFSTSADVSAGNDLDQRILASLLSGLGRWARYGLAGSVALEPVGGYGRGVNLPLARLR